jgi:phosphate transport system substrate-binding protein
MTDRSVDFGCSDSPMSDEELKEAAKVGGAVVHVPLIMGAVAPIYNFPDTKGRLGFSGRLLARICLGQLHRWNDPELQALNPRVPLPDHEIAVVHRLDSSGSTYVWTEYLSKVSTEWQSKVGFGKTVPWPVGLAARGNEGVAGLVKHTPWSIGYAQVTYGIRQSLEYGRVENAAGEFVEPLPAAIIAAAESLMAKLPEDLRFSMTNEPGQGSYPISTATWALAYTTPPDGKGKQLSDFLFWIIHDGQEYGEALDFAPLPQPLVDRGEAKIRGLVDH